MMVVVLVAWPALCASDVVLSGRATVVDGDTLLVNRTRVRLWGIDAPESAQQCTSAQGKAWPCGRRAANALDAQLDGRTVHCQQHDVDRYGRVVAECFVQGRSVNAWMVRSGWAVAYREYARAYVADEELARRERVNLWQGPFQQPADYRRERRSGAVARTSRPAPPKPGCTIKGNISGSGKIYHMPGQRDYAQTRIDQRRGEKLFCTAAEAEAAGWRAAKR